MRTHDVIIRAAWLWSVAAILIFFLNPATRAAGVTVITHGFSGNADGWVLGMAQRVPFHPAFSGTNVLCYEMTVTDNGGGFNITTRKLAGGSPTNDSAAEIVIKLDWGALAGFFVQYDTYEVAAAVVPAFLLTNMIPEMGGRALAELPIHLIGHSRGGSLVCEMARLFGMRGIWVDQVTTLDPHPVNQDGNVDPLSVSDAPLRIYENVLFADNYYQTFGGYPAGQFMASSYNRSFTALPGGNASAHSDTHLWYHATVDQRNTASDTEATLSAADRAAWFTQYEMNGAQAGFHYSRIGEGDRTRTNRPAGAGTDRVAFGLNQRWNFGAGVADNRTTLSSNSGDWPNIIRIQIAGTNVMSQGETNSVSMDAQWSQPATSNAIVSLHLDGDLNPFNGNDKRLHDFALAGTGSNLVAALTVALHVAETNSVPGNYRLFARVSDGVHTRYSYAPEMLTVAPRIERPVLGIIQSGSTVEIWITGAPGQTIVLESTSDFSAWTPVATNSLEQAGWRYSEPAGGHRFFRAVVQ